MGPPQAQLSPRRGVCGPRGARVRAGTRGSGRARPRRGARGRPGRAGPSARSAAPASRRCPRAGSLPRLTSLKLWDFLLLFLSENSMVRARWRRGRRLRRRLRRARVTAAEPPGPRSASRSAGEAEGREEPPRARPGVARPGRSCPRARLRLPGVLGDPSVPLHAASLFPERSPPQPNFPLGAGPGWGAELWGARRGPPGLSLRTRPGGRGEPREGGGGGCGAAAGALTAPAGGGAAPAKGAAPPGPRGHLLAEPGRRHPPGAAATAGLGRAATRHGPEAARFSVRSGPGPWSCPPGRTPRSARPPSAAPGGEPAFRNKPGIVAPWRPALALSERRAVPGPDADFRQLLRGGEELTHPRSWSKQREI